MIVVFVDGLCEPRNPAGIASYGFIIYKEDAKVYEEGKVIGEGVGVSNNVAEYGALCEALKWLSDQCLSEEEIIVKSDSRLLVNQMSGFWECHGGLYVAKFLEALKLAKGFNKISFVWIPREQNSEADSLSRKAYEEHCKLKGIKPRYHNEFFGRST